MGLLQHPLASMLLGLIVYNMDINFNARHVVVLSADCSSDDKSEAPELGKEQCYVAQDSLSNSTCKIRPMELGLTEHIASLYSDGTKLITYHLQMDGYDVNPLVANLTRNYKSDIWKRTFDNHGRTLLTLAFNYDVISLLMLTFGVEEMNIKLEDEPRQCFGNLTQEEKISALLEVLADDFQQDSDVATNVPGEDAHVCHQVIKEKGNQGRFRFRCCRRCPRDGRIECVDNEASKWIRLLYAIIVFLKFMALLFGPIIIPWAIHSESIRKTVYVLKLKETLYKSIYIAKRLTARDDTDNHVRHERQQYKMLRRFLKSTKLNQINLSPQFLGRKNNDKCVNVQFDQLHIHVDHRELMTEQAVPVGAFKFLFEKFLLCRLRKWYPFNTCCAASICGSWTPRFLWFGIKQEAQCNHKLGFFPTWSRVFVFLGGLIILAGIPIPYYIRLALYIHWEKEELISRRNALDTLGLQSEYSHNILHNFSPTHPAMIFFYWLYVICFILLAIIHYWKPDRFVDSVVINAVQDLRRVRRMESIRLFVAHIILPFEKFGILVGLLVGIIYWPIALPVCLLVAIAYCVPLVYLSGRLLINTRPSFMYLKPRPNSHHDLSEVISSVGEAQSFETALLMDNISPRNRLDATRARAKYIKVELNRKQILRAVVSLAVGIICICLMFSILVMFVEVFGFLVEIFVFTLMGAIVNAGIAARYLMLAFWVIMYTSSCFNNAYDEYMALNAKIFEYLKDKLGDDIRQVTLLREERQKNTAFKYFTRSELIQQVETERDLDSGSEDGETEFQVQNMTNYDVDDKFIIKDGQLQWILKCLVLFVDNEDVPRIPKKLFRKICKIQAPGCPGPVAQRLLRATRQFLYMILFLVFVMIIVMSFSSIYNISTTNQMLMTLAGGFVPFVVRYVIKPKKAAVSLGTYSFEGKVHNIIRNFSQPWSVYDMHFKVVDATEPTPQEGAGDRPATDNADDNTPGTLALQGNNDLSPAMAHLFIGFSDGKGLNKSSISEWKKLRHISGTSAPHVMNVNMSKGTIGFQSNVEIEKELEKETVKYDESIM